MQEIACQCRRPWFDPCVGKIPWRRAWQPTPVCLPGESHGERILVDYNPYCCKESNMTEMTEHACMHHQSVIVSSNNVPSSVLDTKGISRKIICHL